MPYRFALSFEELPRNRDKRNFFGPLICNLGAQLLHGNESGRSYVHYLGHFLRQSFRTYQGLSIDVIFDPPSALFNSENTDFPKTEI